MPARAVIGRIAIAVFVEQRCVVKVRMRGNGERQDAGTFSKADRRGIELGRPDVGVHFGANELSDLLRFQRTGIAAELHGEGGKPAVGRGGGAGNVERRWHRRIWFRMDIVGESGGRQRTLEQDEVSVESLGMKANIENSSC